VALGIQHKMLMYHIGICNLPGSTRFFPHNIIKGKIFEKKDTEHKICVLIFSTTLSERFLKYDEIYWTSCRNTDYSCHILIKFQFSVQISEKYSNLNFVKLRLVGAEFQTDGQTYMKKLIVDFSNFAKAREKYCDKYSY
jgi:hypothetical protein